jgi:short-subunit dehydrogenase
MRSALITGASDGIGLEIARLLSAEYAITLVARNPEKLEKAKASLSSSGHSCVVADLSKKAEVDSLKSLMEKNHYDVFINNAGVGMYGLFHEMPLSEQVKMINLNIVAVTALSWFYLGLAKKGDVLINVASTLGTTSFPGAAAYAGTKAFVTAFSESLWWEYKRKGISVYAFCPGATATNFHEVSGRDKNIFPAFVMQQPDQVARALVKSLSQRNNPKVISGLMNRSMLFFHRLMSRRMVVNMMGKFSPIK